MLPPSSALPRGRTGMSGALRRRRAIVVAFVLFVALVWPSHEARAVDHDDVDEGRCLFALQSDRELLASSLDDPKAATTEVGLDDDETRELLAGDRDALVARGAHPDLVFMTPLHLRMEREPAEFEYF